MSEYIERGVLLAHIAGVKICLQGNGEWISGYHDALQAVGEMVQEFPAADVVAVKHGRWEKHKTMHGFVYCSACKDVYLDAEWLADGKWGYCPNCGAKMYGGKDNG